MKLGDVSSLSYQQIPVINSKAVVDDGRVSKKKSKIKNQRTIYTNKRIIC